MGCGGALLSFVMSIFNVIFALIGGTMLGLGIWMLVDDETFEILQYTGDELYWDIALYIIVSVGGLLLLIGLLGCIGTCTSSTLLLLIYGVLVVIAVLAEITAIVFVAIYYANLDDLGEDMQQQIKTQYINETSTDPMSYKWNSMQTQWKCCGSYDYRDYKDSNYRINVRHVVPYTCCTLKYDVSYPIYITDVEDYERCQVEALAQETSSRYLYTEGCYQQMEDTMQLAAPITLGVLSAFVLVQLIGLCLSCALCSKNNKTSQDKMI